LEGWGISVDWQELVGVDWALLVDWLSNDVHNSSKGSWTNWDGDGVSSIIDFLSSNESFGRVKSNCSNVVSTQMLGNFQNQSVLDSLYLKSIENWWESAFELHIDDGTNDLGNFSYGESLRTEAS
jgi:hypothetical protein